MSPSMRRVMMFRASLGLRARLLDATGEDTVSGGWQRVQETGKLVTQDGANLMR